MSVGSWWAEPDRVTASGARFFSIRTTGNSGWDNPTGCCITNNKQANPLFLSPTGLNWHILVTSPAIGFSNMGHIQPVDKDDVPRGSSPAAGAYQP